MMIATKRSGLSAQALKLAVEERRRALSPREWKHRMAGYAYGLKETARGLVLTDLIGGREIGALPMELGA